MANIDLEKLSPVGFKNAETLVALDSNEDVIRVTPPEDYYTDEEIDEKLSEINSELSQLEGRVRQSEQNIIGNTSSINDLTSSVNTITSNISTITSDMTSIKLDVSQNKIDIADLKRTVSANDADITSLEGRVSANEVTISGHTDDIADLDSRVTEMEGNRQDVSDLAELVAQNKADVEAHDGRIGALETRADVNEAQVAENSSDIEQHRNDIQTINGNITIINSNVSDIQSELPRMKKGIHKNSVDIAGLDERLTMDEEIIEANTERIEALEEGLASNEENTGKNKERIDALEVRVTTNEEQTGKNDERIGVLEELIETEGDGTHYLSDDGTYKELIVEKDLFSTRTLYVNSSFDGESNGSVYAPFASLQAAVDATAAGRNYHIRLSVDTLAGDVTIHAGHGQLLIEGVGVTGSSESVIEGDLHISGRSANGRVQLKNIRVSGFTTVSDSAMVYMEDMLFGKTVTISGEGGYQRYDYCFWNGLAVSGSNRVDVRNGEEQSDSEWILNSSSAQLSVVDSKDFVVHHEGGIYNLAGYSHLAADADGYSVYSTADDVVGNSLRMANCDLSQNDGFYGGIDKSGSCVYYLGTSVYEPFGSVLEGQRLDGGMHSDQIYDHNARIGYTPVDDSLAGHLDGISARLDEISHGGPTIVDKVEIVPESYVDIRVASGRNSYGQLYNTAANSYRTYIKQMGDNMRNSAYFGENGVLKNYPYSNFKLQTVPDETVDFYVPNFLDISRVQGTAIRNWLQGDDKRILFTLTDGYASALFSNLAIDGYVGTSNGASASTNRTPGTNTDIDLTSKEASLQNKVYDYIFRSGEFTDGVAIDPAAVSLRAYDGSNQSLSAWPDTFIPLIYSTRYGGRCILGIDPVNRIIFCGDMDMFSNTNDCFVSGASAEPNMKFLNNLLAFATNVCKYGESFTRYFTDTTPLRGVYTVCVENGSRISIPEATDVLSGDGQYYYEITPGTLIQSEVKVNKLLYSVGVIFADLKLVPAMNNTETEIENVKAVNLTVNNGDYSISSLLLNNVQVDNLNITEVANVGLFSVSDYSDSVTPYAMIAPVRYATVSNLEMPEGEVIISLSDDSEQQVIAQSVTAESLTIESTSSSGQMSVELYNINTNSLSFNKTILEEIIFSNHVPGLFRSLTFNQVTFRANVCADMIDSLIESDTALENISFVGCQGAVVTSEQRAALEEKGISISGL